MSEEQNSNAAAVVAQLRTVSDEFAADAAAKINDGKLIAGVVLIAGGVQAEESRIRFYPFVKSTDPRAGKPEKFAAGCLARDLIYALFALDEQYGFGMREPLKLVAMCHPQIARTLAASGGVPVEVKRPDGRRIVRDVVDEKGSGDAGAG